MKLLIRKWLHCLFVFAVFSLPEEAPAAESVALSKSERLSCFYYDLFIISDMVVTDSESVHETRHIMRVFNNKSCILNYA